jgi:hypothetical protein
MKDRYSGGVGSSSISMLERIINNPFRVRWSRQPIKNGKFHILKENCNARRIVRSYYFPKGIDWYDASCKLTKQVRDIMKVKEGGLLIRKNKLKDHLDSIKSGIKIELEIRYHNCPDLENWLYRRGMNLEYTLNVMRKYYTIMNQLIKHKPLPEYKDD